MSDVIDVQNAYVDQLSSLIYPNGTEQASSVGFPCVIYAGWPTASRLDADLIAGKAHITVFPRPEERNTTRYQVDWQQQSLNTASLTLTVNGQIITIGGAMPVPFTAHVLSVLVNGKPYPYQVVQSDTLNSIATALAALIAVDIAGTTAAGAVITVPNAGRVGSARVGVTGTSAKEVRRQERTFQITVWANTPANRDAISKVVDQALAALNFLTMPDGFAARNTYKSSPVTDAYQKEKLYRRDFFYMVEFATTLTETDTQITQEQLNTSKQIDGATTAGPTTTTYF